MATAGVEVIVGRLPITSISLFRLIVTYLLGTIMRATLYTYRFPHVRSYLSSSYGCCRCSVIFLDGSFEGLSLQTFLYPVLYVGMLYTHTHTHTGDVQTDGIYTQAKPGPNNLLIFVSPFSSVSPAYVKFKRYYRHNGDLLLLPPTPAAVESKR